MTDNDNEVISAAIMWFQIQPAVLKDAEIHAHIQR